MPTTRGWAALGAGAALSVLWVAFGERLLLAVAAFFLIAITLGTGYVRLAAPRVAILRRISPIQVHDGDRAIVEVTLESPRRIYQVAVEDTVHGLGSAHFIADRVEPAQPMVARYEILCRPRGVYQVGPADVRVRDPLGLTESGGTTGSADRLVVYPAVEDLIGVPSGRGHDPTVNTSRAAFSHSGGEDFFTLREYAQGDDLRRVHWPSSAKRDELMIKQLEMPWQSRAFIVLDPRRTGNSHGETFEHAVRGAASVLRHLFRSGYTPTLWAGAGSGTLVGSAETYALAMEELAAIEPLDSIDLSTAIARLRRSGVAGGVLVLVSGPPDAADLAAFRALAGDFYRTIVMSVAQQGSEAILQFARGGAVTVRSNPDGRWAPAWKEAIERSWSTATAG
jgi:uncharacterized protein (DUF58 family)